MAAATKEPAWYEGLPAPRNTTPGSISRQELLTLLSKKSSVKEFVLVDLRRTDYQVSLCFFGRHSATLKLH